MHQHTKNVDHANIHLLIIFLKIYLLAHIIFKEQCLIMRIEIMCPCNAAVSSTLGKSSFAVKNKPIIFHQLCGCQKNESFEFS